MESMWPARHQPNYDPLITTTRDSSVKSSLPWLRPTTSSCTSMIQAWDQLYNSSELKEGLEQLPNDTQDVPYFVVGQPGDSFVRSPSSRSLGRLSC